MEFLKFTRKKIKRTSEMVYAFIMRIFRRKEELY
nr:MAG TPA: hypothetical protein [Caudoviricetes sp.]